MLTNTRIVQSRTLVRHAFAALAAICVLATADVARAGDTPGAYPSVCAEKDLQVVTLIELTGLAHLVSADVLADAYVSVLKARDFCEKGQVAEGIAVYEGLLPGFEPDDVEIHAAR